MPFSIARTCLPALDPSCRRNYPAHDAPRRISPRLCSIRISPAPKRGSGSWPARARENAYADLPPTCGLVSCGSNFLLADIFSRPSAACRHGLLQGTWPGCTRGGAAGLGGHVRIMGSGLAAFPRPFRTGPNCLIWRMSPCSKGMAGCDHFSDAKPLSPETWGSIAPESLGDVRFTPHPAHASFRSRYAAVSIFSPAEKTARLNTSGRFDSCRDGLIHRPGLRSSRSGFCLRRCAISLALTIGETLGGRGDHHDRITRVRIFPSAISSHAGSRCIVQPASSQFQPRTEQNPHDNRDPLPSARLS